MIRFHEPKKNELGNRILSLSVRHDKNYTPADVMLLCAADEGYETGRTEYGKLYVKIDNQRYFYDHWIINDINPTLDYIIIHLTTDPYSHEHNAPRVLCATFDPNWTQNDIIEIVKTNSYYDFEKHADMKAFCIDCSDFNSKTRNWNKLSFIVPKNWLIMCVNTLFNIKSHDLDNWLMNECTSDKSMQIFMAAIEDKQIVLLNFA